MAFLHALSFEEEGRGVSGIHFPREAPDPWRAPSFKKGLEDARYGKAAAELAWDVFNAVFRLVAARIPLVCAAGNEGYARLSCPASEARGDNGVVSVGAISFAAKRSGCSTYADAAGPETLTIAAPSDDAKVCTRWQVRLDRESPRWRDHTFLPPFDGADAIPGVVHSPEAVLAPDVPGPRGHASGALAGGAPTLAPSRCAVRRRAPKPGSRSTARR